MLLPLRTSLLDLAERNARPFFWLAVCGSSVGVFPRAFRVSGTAALTLDTNTQIGAYAMIYPPVARGDSTGAATGDMGGEVMLSQPAMAPGLKLDPDSAFNGNRVLSSEGTEIGVVQEVVTQSDGQKLLVVQQAGATGSDGRFTLTVDGAAVADGEITLGWTEAELSAAIAAL